MKKGIIIAVMLCSILISERVKADTIQPLGFEFRNESGNVLPQLSGAPPYVRGYSFTQNSNTASGTLPFYLTSDKSYYMYKDFDYALINLYAYIENQRQNYETSIGGINIENEKIQGLTFYVEMITNGTWSQCNLENSATNGSGNYVMYTIKCPRAKNVTGIQKFNIQYNYYNQSIGSDSAIINLGLSYSLNFISGDSASIIENQNQNTQTILDENTTYNENATQDYTNQTEEINNITMAEDQLLNNLDFNTTDMNITINPNASQFIWNIVEGLRSINGAIALLMTSLLSIGIIKLVLGR